MEPESTTTTTSSWSILDKFTPEIFSFGFDPEILSCLWGLFRTSDKAPDAPRLLPTAPFYIAVHSKITSGDSIFSALQLFFTTGGVVLGVALSSYGVYTMIQSAREKLKQSEESSALIVSSRNLTPAGPGPGPGPGPGTGTDAQVQTQSNDYFQTSKDSYFSLQFPVRPTSLNVGIRSTATGTNKMWDSKDLYVPKDPYFESEVEDGEDIADVRAEYFGPAAGDTGDMNSFDDSESSSNFQTPCT